jgi:hypothetical protein
VPSGASGERALFLSSTNGAVHVFVAAVAPASRCAAAATSFKVYRKNLEPPDGLAVGCGLRLSAVVERGNETHPAQLTVVEGTARKSQDVPIEGETRLTFDENVTDPSAGRCVPASPGQERTVAVQLDRAMPGSQSSPGPEMTLRVPLLGIEHHTKLAANMYCHSRRFLSAGRVDVHCSADETGEVVRLEVRRGALFASTIDSDYGGEARTEFGGVTLPCDATLLWPRVHWPNSHWSAIGNCPACQYAEDLCQDPCIERLTDDKGDLTEKGSSCAERCTRAAMSCVRGCVHD